MNTSHKNPQRGFSLVELMIAILISVFLVGGLLTLVQAMKATTLTQNGLSTLQDSERFSSDLIGDVIQAAGDYPESLVAVGGNYTQFPAINVIDTTSGKTLVFLQGQTLTGVDTASPQGSLIGVRYMTSGTDGIISCAGSTSTVSLTFINIFSVDTNGNLQCQLTTVSPPPANTIISAGTVTKLVNGVKSLNLLFGTQTNSAVTTLSADSYLTAAQLTALAPASLPQASAPSTAWMMVKSVQYSLLFTNPLAAQPSQPATIPLMRVINVMNQVGEGQT